MALITTPGAANADSYATLAEADAYNASRSFTTGWGGSDEAKEASLQDAARRLDASFRWTGAAVDDVQVLTWPRSGMLSRNGFPIATTEIPGDLKDAQSELARLLLTTDIWAEDEAAKLGVSRTKAGPVEVEFKRPSDESDSLELRIADVARMGPAFDYLRIPVSVRNLIPPSWYLQGSALLAAQSFYFSVSR